MGGGAGRNVSDARATRGGSGGRVAPRRAGGPLAPERASPEAWESGPSRLRPRRPALPAAPLLPVEIAGRTFHRLDLTDPEIEARIVEEMRAGVDVYYDREWGFTRRFCRLLLEHPELLAGKDVLVVGAGVGLEAVVAGALCDGLWINDWAPEALALLRWQLRENGVEGARPLPGSFAEVDLPPVDLVVACFVVYDRETRAATMALEERAAEADVPLLLGGEDIGGHLSALLDRVDRPVHALLDELETEGQEIALVGAEP